MKYNILGKTGLTVSNFGLGTGSPTREKLLLNKNNSFRLFDVAYDNGVNVIDTAPAYKTEELVADWVKTKFRESIFVFTKTPRVPGFLRGVGWGGLLDGFIRNLDYSVKKFGYIDVYFYHSLTKGIYSKMMSEDIFASLLKERDKGKFRYIGISERTNEFTDYDSQHNVIKLAIQDKLIDVIMLTMNEFSTHLLLRSHVLNIGTVVMRAFVNKPDNPVLAYKKSSNADVVLIGTSNINHLLEDIGA